MGKVLIISAPSGSGKTTVVNHLLESFDCFAFSVSATTRAPRGVEKDGEAYYFISEEEFRRRIAADAFIEYEEVYKGVLYGTLKSEVDRIWKQGKVILFDVDVKGGVNLKKYFGRMPSRSSSRHLPSRKSAAGWRNGAPIRPNSSTNVSARPASR